MYKSILNRMLTHDHIKNIYMMMLDILHIGGAWVNSTVTDKGGLLEPFLEVYNWQFFRVYICVRNCRCNFALRSMKSGIVSAIYMKPSSEVNTWLTTLRGQTRGKRG